VDLLVSYMYFDMERFICSFKYSVSVSRELISYPIL